MAQWAIRGNSPASAQEHAWEAVRGATLDRDRRYALSAEIMDAPTALQLGLAHQIVAHDALDHAIDTMIGTLAKGSPQAQRATKALLASVAWMYRLHEAGLWATMQQDD